MFPELLAQKKNLFQHLTFCLRDSHLLPSSAQKGRLANLPSERSYRSRRKPTVKKSVKQRALKNSSTSSASSPGGKIEDNTAIDEDIDVQSHKKIRRSPSRDTLSALSLGGKATFGGEAKLSAQGIASSFTAINHISE
ncbi:hypothetical protein LTR84_006745 [Exophiala bonariae]|uniref:Uncharacterized protein n=1 Tax=Exophiala bonariae TaxID=1690606 RepID=A0AAV9MZU0_9EURO|nr:hypothetical protein LTR84_006745 [Exophiala bonariae]